MSKSTTHIDGIMATLTILGAEKKPVDAETLTVDEYARAVVNIMSANHEFSGMSFEEYLQ